MDTRTMRHKNLGALHDLLLKACPPNEKGRQSIPDLADSLGVSYQYIYRWIKKAKIPAKYTLPLVTVSEGRCTVDDFLPYVI